MTHRGRFLPTARVALFALSAFTLLTQSDLANAQSVEEFYKGKTIRIVTSTGAASTYTTYAQLVADFIGPHIPGKPNLIVQTMPGAGGVRAANHMANAAPQDGSMLATVHETLASEQVLKPEGIQFDMSKFKWIGVMSMITSTLTVNANAPATTIDGAKQKEVIVASTGRGSITHQLPTLLNAMFGTKFKIVGGYQAMGEMTLAMERGEVHGRAGSLVGWTQSRAKDIAEGKFVHMVQVNLRKDATLPDVPLLADLARNERERQMLEFMSSSALMGRSLMGPPGMPDDRVAALRAAFQAMLKDPAFIEAAAKRNHDILPATGEEVAAAVAKTVALPKDLAAELSRILDQ